MNKAPQSFTDYCKDSQVPHDKTQGFWLVIWENSIEEFLTWLIKKSDLSHDQLIKLDKLFNRFINDKNINQNIIETITPILNSKQEKKAINQLATCFINHLNRFYADHKIKEKAH